jgi:hypothetical protein
MLPQPFFAETYSLALANFYAGLSEMPDHRILDYWNFTVYIANNQLQKLRDKSVYLTNI